LYPAPAKPKQGISEKDEAAEFLKNMPVLNFKEAFGSRSIIDDGGFSTVWSATWRNNLVAVKQFKNSLETQGAKSIIKISKELFILSNMRHARTLSLLYHFRDDQNIYLVTQYYPRKSLYHLLYEEHVKLHKDNFCILAKDICEGLIYLHNHDPKILHLDLKPKNLLIDGVQEPRAVIADFGISVVKRQSQQSSNNTQCGTYPYMAPEIGIQTTEKADIYSLGIIMWEMLHSLVPYCDIQPQAKVFDYVKQGTRPKWKEELHLPKQLIELIEKCWSSDVTIRPAANEVLQQITILYGTEPIKF